MPSSQTLAQLRTRTLLLLQDTGAATWATGDIDEALTEALDLYSELLPQRKIGTITLSAAGREIDVSSLTGYIAIERIWWDYIHLTSRGYGIIAEEVFRVLVEGGLVGRESGSPN